MRAIRWNANETPAEVFEVRLSHCIIFAPPRQIVDAAIDLNCNTIFS